MLPNDFYLKRAKELERRLFEGGGSTPLTTSAESRSDAIGLNELVRTVHRAEIKVTVAPGGETLAEKLPAHWPREEVDELLCGFILKVETAPKLPDEGTVAYFETEEKGYMIDMSKVFSGIKYERTPLI